MKPGLSNDGARGAKKRTYSVQESQALLVRASKVDAFVRARPSLHFPDWSVSGVPLFVKEARGAYLWDLDGNRYIDFILGHGSVVLGHGDRDVSSAVAKTLSTGPNPTLIPIQQVELAEMIVSCAPNLESAVFLKTGSDATGAAVRLARSVTGRRLVLQWGLHGWHDWCSRSSPGVSPEAKSETLTLTYNNRTQVQNLFRRHGKEIACVIMMPFEVDSPDPGYLETVRSLCSKHGALLIFDEIRSGFRIGWGGGQEYFGVQADLVTFGKAMANGYTISALAGADRYMGRILDVAMTSTFFRAPDVFAASLTTLRKISWLRVPTALARSGALLMEKLARAARKHDVPAIPVGHPSMPFLRFNYQSEARNKRAMKFFCNGMLRRGILMTPEHHWFVAYAMSESDILETAAAAERVMKEIGASI